VTKKRAALVIFWLYMLMMAYWALFGVRRTRVETVQNLVSQNLKDGESSSQVIGFLDVQHLEHSELMKHESMILGRGHDYRNQNVIVAIKRKTWVSMLQSESIQLVFVFDDNDQLVRFDVFPRYTGL
jgi:hypothetical protein